MDRTVTDYRGNRIHIVCKDEDIAETVYQALVLPYLSDLEYSWMCGTNSETHVKNYLEYVGTLMIRRPKENKILDPRKLRHVRGMEVSTGNVDKPPRNIPPAPTKRKRKAEESKMSRMNQVLREYPGCRMSWHRVDTDGVFQVDSRRYQISATVSKYQPKRTTVGELYDMDTVVAAKYDGKLMFYDQDMFPMEGNVQQIS